MRTLNITTATPRTSPMESGPYQQCHNGRIQNCTASDTGWSTCVDTNELCAGSSLSTMSHYSECQNGHLYSCTHYEGAQYDECVDSGVRCGLSGLGSTCVDPNDPNCYNAASYCGAGTVYQAATNSCIPTPANIATSIFGPGGEWVLYAGLLFAGMVLGKKFLR